jgi:hypothetical protein
MTFYEFLLAIEKPLCAYIDEFDLSKPKVIPSVVHEKIIQLLLYYFAVGGLPEVVLRFQEHYLVNLAEALKNARQVQHELIVGYESDFSKYSGTVNANHIHSVSKGV